MVSLVASKTDDGRQPSMYRFRSIWLRLKIVIDFSVGFKTKKLALAELQKPSSETPTISKLLQPGRKGIENELIAVPCNSLV